MKIPRYNSGKDANVAVIKYAIYAYLLVTQIKALPVPLRSIPGWAIIDVTASVLKALGPPRDDYKNITPSNLEAMKEIRLRLEAMAAGQSVKKNFLALDSYVAGFKHLVEGAIPEDLKPPL